MKQLQIVLKTPLRRKSKQEAAAKLAGMKKMTISFVTGRDSWYYCISELKEGNLVSLAWKLTSILLL